jgi:hypothetical protein
MGNTVRSDNCSKITAIGFLIRRYVELQKELIELQFRERKEGEKGKDYQKGKCCLAPTTKTKLSKTFKIGIILQLTLRKPANIFKKRSVQLSAFVQASGAVKAYPMITTHIHADTIRSSPCTNCLLRSACAPLRPNHQDEKYLKRIKN